ncbi:hypothetical protein BU23DRAFT_12134 [Bimuria novae-zelandiae CBS 107.79]|uniref:Alpha-ketoglutarate-dependent dioxygenase AlkB-like domain-containing protein n=1 Tax=Bimuria novae-zelandiae CBS 107.79 TaxID=1447943 RepID=A0A6A5VGS8_9PLEO|nr:hypothetical protein BU23DRAFT_12134 [Bimuria novae-zelandiae CBS 107.79]
MSFDSYSIVHPENLFPLLHQSVQFEDFSKGRQIAILYRTSADAIPLVRTTTAYQTPSQPFSPIHEALVEKIRDASGITSLQLNNAMLEVYDARYTTMRFHTDQALDLTLDSYICLFSCYEKGADAQPRVLTVRKKESGEEWEVELEHHSVVVFSTATNQEHVHKIEAKDLPRDYDNRWMGLTLRLAKTFVRFEEGVAHLVVNGCKRGELTLATSVEAREFYKYKGAENRETTFEYPDIGYTISPSDRMPPSPNNLD